MNRIAVALDFDEEAPDILDTAQQLGKKMGAEIHIVHVYPPEPVPVMAPDAYSYLVDTETPEEHEELLQEEKTKIREEVSKLRKADINAQGYMKPEDKNIAYSILDFFVEHRSRHDRNGHQPPRQDRTAFSRQLRGSSIATVDDSRAGHSTTRTSRGLK